MKKFLSRVLISSLLCGSMPAFADDDHGSSSSGGGGGGSSSGAAIGIAVGGVAIAGLIGYLIYRANKDKDQGLPKAEDPFAAPSNETATTNAPPSSSTGAASGGIGSNQKLEF